MNTATTATATATAFDFSNKDFKNLIVHRRIPTAPFRLSPIHFSINTDYDNLACNIKNTLDEMNITYSYPDSISTFFVSGHPSDSDYNCEIRIYSEWVEQGQPVSFIVEIYRYGGDGFLTFDIYDKLYYQYYPEEKPDNYVIDFTYDTTNGDFNGVPLDYCVYDDLVHIA